MSNYIMDLRRVVGHAPLLQAGASIIIENENGQVLLGKRTDNHQWGYAGGFIELWGGEGGGEGGGKTGGPFCVNDTDTARPAVISTGAEPSHTSMVHRGGRKSLGSEFPQGAKPLSLIPACPPSR